MKLSIVGPGGAGKSTLAKNISKKFSLPRLELDRLWFESGGHDCFINGCTPEEKMEVSNKIKKRVEQFLSENDKWVIDGTYKKIQPLIAEKADNIILVKRSVFKRLVSHIIRVFKNEGRHPETTKWQDLYFSLSLVKRWLKYEDYRLQDFLSVYSHKLIVLKSFREIDDYLTSLKDDIQV